MMTDDFLKLLIIFRLSGALPRGGCNKRKWWGQTQWELEKDTLSLSAGSWA